MQMQMKPWVQHTVALAALSQCCGNAELLHNKVRTPLVATSGSVALLSGSSLSNACLHLTLQKQEKN